MVVTSVPGVRSVPVRPLTTAWADAVTSDFAFIDGLVRGFGQPLHLLDADQFVANARAFAGVFDSHGVDGTVYFGKKANKAATFADAIAQLSTECRRHGSDRKFGVDVASAGEFRQALAAGIRGTDLLITGPHKPTELLTLAVRHDAVVTVDSPTELTELAAAADGMRTRVLLRVLPTGDTSRFGMTSDELDWAQRFAVDHRADTTLIGYSFHLSSYSLCARSHEAHRLIDRVEAVRRTAADVHTISIGGGFPVDYVSRDEWNRFIDPAAPHAFHAGKSFSGYYPYHSPIAGAAALHAVLTATAGNSVAQRCRDAQITVFAEPGRALLDQAGLTIFPVAGVKDRDPGLVVVNGTSLSLSEQWFNTEFVPQPQLLRAPRSRTGARPFHASVGAATCLESDMLTWRVIEFPDRPESGDYLVYHNTAGYQMDSNESAFHDTPIPPKIAVKIDSDGHKSWILDRRTVT